MEKQKLKTVSVGPVVLERLQRESASYFSLNALPHLLTFSAFLCIAFRYSSFMWATFTPEKPNGFDTTRVLVLTNFSVALFFHSFYVCLYVFRVPFFEKFKSNTLPWPWEEDMESWKASVKDGLLTMTFHYFVLFPVPFSVWMNWFPLLAAEESLPTFWRFVVHFFVLLFVHDFLFYWLHRLLHQPFFYQWIHKVHHRNHNSTIISVFTNHWIEFYTSGLLLFLLPTAIFRGQLHMVTYTTFFTFRTIESIESHCGYDFPWSPFKIFHFSTESTYHNFHHLKNMGNYADLFCFWDTLFGTNEDFLKEINGGKRAIER